MLSKDFGERLVIDREVNRHGPLVERLGERGIEIPHGGFGQRR